MRKGLIVAVALVALLALPAVVAADGLPMKGDVNGDRRVTVVDANQVARYAVDPTGEGGILTVLLTSEQIQCADVNGDGRVNITDSNQIARFAIDPTGQGGVLLSYWPALWEGSTEFAPPAP